MLDHDDRSFYYCAMDEDIAQLETRIDQLIALYEKGKGEIRDLRAKVSALQADNTRLSTKVDMATSEIESILQEMPE